MTFEEQVEQIRKSNEMIDPKGLKWGKMDLDEQIAFLSTPEAVKGHGQWWVKSISQILTDIAPLLKDVEASLKLLQELDNNYIALQSPNAECEALPYGYNANFFAERIMSRPGFDEKGKSVVILDGPYNRYGNPKHFKSDYDLHINHKGVYFTHKDTNEILPFEKWTDDEKEKLVQFIEQFPYFKKALDNFIEELGNQPKVYAIVEEWDTIHHRGHYNPPPYPNGVRFFIPEEVYRNAGSIKEAEEIAKTYILETYGWQKRSDNKSSLAIQEMRLSYGIQEYFKDKEEPNKENMEKDEPEEDMER